MDIRIDTIQSVTDIPECISISQIWQALALDEHLQCLKNIIITGWPSTKDKLHSDLRPYWSYRDDLAVIDGVVMKGRCIIIPAVLKQQVLDQLNLITWVSKKKKQSYSSAHPYIGSILIHRQAYKNCNMCLEFQ